VNESIDTLDRVEEIAELEEVDAADSTEEEIALRTVELALPLKRLPIRLTVVSEAEVVLAYRAISYSTTPSTMPVMVTVDPAGRRPADSSCSAMASSKYLDASMISAEVVKVDRSRDVTENSPDVVTLNTSDSIGVPTADDDTARDSVAVDKVVLDDVEAAVITDVEIAVMVEELDNAV